MFVYTWSSILYPFIPLRLSQRLNFSLESVRALRASTSFSFSLFFSSALPWKEGRRGCLSGFDGMERERKRNVRKAQKGSYLVTKLSCLMLEADVAQSILKELREERVWLKSSGKLGRHFACKETSSFVLVAPTYSCDLNVIRTRVGGEEASLQSAAIFTPDLYATVRTRPLSCRGRESVVCSARAIPRFRKNPI